MLSIRSLNNRADCINMCYTETHDGKPFCMTRDEMITTCDLRLTFFVASVTQGIPASGISTRPCAAYQTVWHGCIKFATCCHLADCHGRSHTQQQHHCDTACLHRGVCSPALDDHSSMRRRWPAGNRQERRYAVAGVVYVSTYPKRDTPCLDGMQGPVEVLT